MVVYFVNNLKIQNLGSMHMVCWNLRVPAMGQNAYL